MMGAKKNEANEIEQLVRKYDLNGELVWESQIPIDLCNGRLEVDIDKEGNVYVSSSSTFENCRPSSQKYIHANTAIFNKNGRFSGKILYETGFISFLPISKQTGLVVSRSNRVCWYQTKEEAVEIIPLFSFGHGLAPTVVYDEFNQIVFAYQPFGPVKVADMKENIEYYTIKDTNILSEKIYSMNLITPGTLRLVGDKKSIIISY